MNPSRDLCNRAAAKQALKDAKEELLAVAQRAVDDLNEVGEELGFRYELTDVTKKQDAEATAPPAKPPADTKRNRRSATDIDILKQNILAYIKTDEKGMTGRTIYDHFNVTGTTDEQNYGTYIAKLVEDNYLKKITETEGTDKKTLAKKDIRYKWLRDMAKTS